MNIRIGFPVTRLGDCPHIVTGRTNIDNTSTPSALEIFIIDGRNWLGFAVLGVPNEPLAKNLSEERNDQH